MNYRTHKARHRAAVLAAIAGLAVLAAGCGGGGLTVSSPSHGSGTPSSTAGGAGGPQVNPNVPHGNQGFVSPAQESAGTGSRSGVTGGALFGGTTALAKDNGKLGRRLAIVREYYRIGDSFPTPQNRQLMASGSTLLVSLDTVAGKGPSYASIAAGHEDAAIGSFLKAMNQDAVMYHLGAIYISFQHEADNPYNRVLGSPSEFIRAWDHVHQLAQSDHLDWNDGGRLHWVLILTHWAYFLNVPQWMRKTGGASAYWPGTGEVDIVGTDGYNHSGCENKGGPGGRQAPEDLFDPVLSFAHSHGGLPVFIAEWGSQAGNDAAQQPAFISQMQAFVSANHEIAAVMYFDGRSREHRGCSSMISTQSTSLAAMAAMGHSAALQGRIEAAA